MPDPRKLIRSRAWWQALAGASAATVVALADSWRTALVAVLAAGAIRATRVRFAAAGALALLVVTAVVALGGGAAAQDRRPAPARVIRSHHGARRTEGARGPRASAGRARGARAGGRGGPA